MIGSFTGGSGGADLVVTFNANATSVGVTMVMQNVTYENTNTDNPTIGTRSVDFTVTDGDGGTSFSNSANINFAAINDAPVITSGPGGGTHNEGAPGSYFNNGLTITDADSADFDGGQLSVSVTAAGEVGDRLLILDGNNVTTSGSDVLYDFGGGPVVIGSFTGGSHPADLVITFNSSSDVASVEAVAQQVAFRTEIDDPSTTQRTLEMNLTDGDTGTSNTVARTMNVVAQNDAPVTSVTAFSPTFNENGGPVGLFNSASVDVIEAGDVVSSMVFTVSGLANGADEFLNIDGSGVFADQWEFAFDIQQWL